MHFQYMTYLATPRNKNPCSRGHEILKKCINFTLFTLKSPSYALGVIKFTISCFLSYRYYIPNLGKISLVVFEKKMLIYDGQQSYKRQGSSVATSGLRTPYVVRRLQNFMMILLKIYFHVNRHIIHNKVAAC